MFKSVSIIIPALNEESNIQTCLESLRAMDHDGIEVEIILVDNGSTDKTVQTAEQYGIRVIVKKDVTVAALRNIGAKQCQGQILAFLDADCMVTHDWLTKALECLLRESADAVGSFYIAPDTGWIGRAAELIQGRRSASNVSYIPSGNLILKHTCFLSVDGFDESLETNEDVDICTRLKRKGFKLFLDSAIRVVHLGAPKNITDLFLKQLWHGKSSWTVFYRDLKKVRNLRIVLYSLLNLVLLVCVLISAFCYLFNQSLLYLIISASCYFILTTFIAFQFWYRTRKDFYPVFTYIIVYGIARSLSMLQVSAAYLLRYFKNPVR